MIFLLLFYTVSSQSCPDGTYYDHSLSVCTPCDHTCSTCSKAKTDYSAGCITCKNPTDYFTNGNCYALCEGSTSCYTCYFSCNHCIGPNNNDCVDCFWGFNLYKGMCIYECPTGTYSDSGICKTCDPSCNGCTGGTSDTCISCNSGYYNISNACLAQVCGDGIIEGSEQCDDGNYINGDGCSNCKIDVYVCYPPSILNSYYSDDFNKFYIQFSENVTVSANDCSYFVNKELLGNNPICLFNGAIIEIIFGDSPELTWKDYLQISNGSIYGACHNTTSYSLRATGSDPEFGAMLLGTQMMGKCDPILEVKLSLFSTRNRKIYSVIWSIFQIIPLVSNDEIASYATLSKVLNSNFNGSYSYIPNSNLALGKTYIIKVSVYNFLGQHIDVFSTTETKNISSPVFYDFGFETLFVKPETELTIRADAYACEIASEIVFDWEVTQLSTVNNSQSKISMILSEQYDRILIINKYLMSDGDEMNITVHAWPAHSMKDAGYRIISIKYMASEILARINPRCVSILQNETIELNAWDSMDLGKPEASLNYSWVLKYFGNTIETSASAIFQIDGSKLSTGIHKVYLTVSRGSKSDEDEIDLIVGNNKGDIYIDMGKYLETDEYIKVNSSYFSGIWSSNLVSSSALNYKENRFFRENIEGYGFVNWTTSKIACNEIINFGSTPYSGSFTVEPTIGFPYKTLFTLSANLWENAFNYQFFYIDTTLSGSKNIYVPLTDRIFQNNFATYLPKIPNYITLVLRVYSLSGSYIERIVYVNFNQTGPEITLNSKNEIVEELTALIPINHYEKLLQTSAILSSLLRSPVHHFLPDITSCICGTNGNCVDNKCVCNTGWEGNTCEYEQGEINIDTKIASTLLNNINTAFTYLPRNKNLDLMTSAVLVKILSKTEIITLDTFNQVLNILQSFLIPSSIDTNWNDQSCGKILGDEILEGTIENIFICLSSLAEVGNNSQSSSYISGIKDYIISSLNLLGNIMTYQKTIYENSVSLKTDILSASFAKLENFSGSFIDTNSNSSMSNASASLSINGPKTLFTFIEIKLNIYNWISQTNSSSSLIIINHNTADTCQTQTINAIVNVSIPITNPTKELNYNCVSWSSKDWTPDGSLEGITYSNTSYRSDITNCTFSHLSAYSVSSYIKKVEPIVISSRNRKDYNLPAIILLAAIAALDILWIIWGVKRDNRDAARVSPASEQSFSESSSGPLQTPPKTNIFWLILKNCHYFASIFYRYDPELPRSHRILIVNVRVIGTAGILAYLNFLISGILIVVCLALVACGFSFLLGVFLIRLCKEYSEDNKVEMDSNANFQDAVRRSPVIKLPEIEDAARQQYFHVRNLSTTTAFHDSANISAVSLRERSKRIVGWLIGISICGCSCYSILTANFNWYIPFIAGLCLDFFGLQIASMFFQYLAIKVGKGIDYFASKKMKEIISIEFTI
ncbi:unnamed protein product [Blepharisma stoltei]|uniref:GPS domain-containing protein n=1 Tax=Blepharisma stoltei TaxID=1481888 RepID=A0AAU9J4W2_9CILI|nr:unnamed protein product [Blepharisma stoltei]